MVAVTFDTLKFVETLEKAGVPSEQARAFSAALKESRDAADLVTKQDLNLVRKDINLVRTELNARMDTMESRLIIKLGGITVATITVATAILAAVIRL